MWTWRTLVTFLLLILPFLSESVITTCDIPSVEAGDSATLTIHFSEDLTNARLWVFSIVHVSHSKTESEMLSCVFSNGTVKCNNAPCCTWESKVTDVFRVYIHNASQQLEGKFLPFLLPSDVSNSKNCTFTLKASICFTNSIKATNSHVTCTNQSVAIGQTCTVICNSGHYFQGNQASMTFTCVGTRKWSPEIPVKSCEAVTCLRESINATNTQVTCSDQSVTIGQTCTVICNSGHYFQGHRTSSTYTCVGKNKWSPEIPLLSCEEHSKDQKSQNLYFLFLLLSALPIITVVVFLFKRRQKGKTRKRKNKEDLMSPLTSDHMSTLTSDHMSPLTSDHMSLLSLDHMSPLTSDHMSPLTSDPMSPLTSDPMSLLASDHMSLLTSDHMSPLTSDHMSPLTSDPMSPLTLDHMSPLTSDHMSPLTSDHMSPLTSDHMSPLNADPSLSLNSHLLLPLKSTKLQLRDLPSQKSPEDYWLECIRIWYPKLQSRTYFLPPFHFNRVSYGVRIVAGNQVLVPQNRQDSDVRVDRALERVLQCLRALADDPQQKQVMMVVSQLQFGKYLGEPSYAAAAALLQSPSKLPEEFLPHRYDKGDCDVLIIHSKHGLLTLEIRSVGGNFSQKEMTEQEQDDVVMKEVKKAVKQLNRAEVVLKHLTKECITTTHITKILVLPNIKSSQLLRALNRTPDLQSLCQCFGVQNVDDAVKLCLLSDQLSDKHMSSDGNHNSHQALREWWQHIVKASGSEQLMTSSLYEQLVARFCGPATAVELHCVTAPRLSIRTLGEAVSETGERMARLVLFPQQVDILNRSPRRAFLSGPPGTGKTIVLIMQGLTWLQRGHDVHVVSTCDGSRAATIVIEHQLHETAKTSTARSRVHRHQFDFWKDGEVETAVRRLKSLNEGRQLCVIADEVVRDDRKSFPEFCDQLIEQVPGVFIWGATVYHEVRPLCLEEVKLTTPLRSPPVVVREVMETSEIKSKQVHDYTVSDVPVPTDGPPVMLIEHRDGQSGHTGGLPLYCVECGHQVARVLTELDVGRTGDSNGPPPLQYRDVLVLCVGYPNDDRVKGFGLKTTTASGLVRGLRDRHVPVRVVEEGDETAIRDTALGVGDLVTVADWDDVQGLERKVVVVERTGVFARLLAMSRCTSQLVVIDYLPF